MLTVNSLKVVFKTIKVIRLSNTLSGSHYDIRRHLNVELPKD